MIRKAVSADIKEIMDIIRVTIIEMHSNYNQQWDETYPQEKDFIRDISCGDLYVLERDGKLIAFVCVNTVEPSEYKGLCWSQSKEAMVIHRMSVDPEYRRKGVAKELMIFAEDLAKIKSNRYLKTDTYSTNDKMNALFIKCGYNFIGEIRLIGKEKPYYCYDKVLGDA
ncbi:Acetyltransferase, GNAT family [Candidatus Desulfosporosinus infrequens]|uniref:Acetyltransferase, GNAT family n=1 Tax=Candidatus Desulfosporosinus infrequens TaxID=2043169 RepID=A0A2U3LQJ9_9FIRM|nr:Acetyltransferase, GNAT family [Candidatus Desulfosporosinus infrequens]